ncbi:MAG TPA: hypothetical protein VK601_04485, partial [Kofleriaceae bacterium]|nr:hypothetical protein [Kofleriaceae bacterium]
MLATMMSGCALDAPAAAQDEPRAAPAATSAFQRALNRALSNGAVSNAEWTQQLQPLAQQFPHVASSDANAL